MAISGLSSCVALYINCFSFSYSTFIDLVDSEESDNKESDEESTEFMELQNAIALSFQKSR